GGETALIARTARLNPAISLNNARHVSRVLQRTWTSLAAPCAVAKERQTSATGIASSRPSATEDTAGKDQESARDSQAPDAAASASARPRMHRQKRAATTQLSRDSRRPQHALDPLQRQIEASRRLPHPLRTFTRRR